MVLYLIVLFIIQILIYSDRTRRLEVVVFVLSELNIYQICNGYIALAKFDFFILILYIALVVIALKSPFLIPASMHVSTSLQFESLLLGITYQQPSSPHRLSVYLKNVSQKYI